MGEKSEKGNSILEIGAGLGVFAVVGLIVYGIYNYSKLMLFAGGYIGVVVIVLSLALIVGRLTLLTLVRGWK